ncbi:MAG TPA: carboxymuconolactone decarboxylase family protein [Burkholderiaceae bacterium]|nr:carboxymuconolactone decarboxylase family protein [Burkholderiaceae bacterium]
MTAELSERLPPLQPDQMNDAQRRAAAELAAGPRGGVKGPFTALLRSPELMDRMQKVGEYLRFGSVLPHRINEFATLLASVEWSNQFEWHVHVPLALKAGMAPAVVEAIAERRRPAAMARDEAVVHDLCIELFRTRGVSDSTYRAAVDEFGEQGLVELLCLLGYFATVCMVMNAAHTPPPAASQAPALRPLPL